MLDISRIKAIIFDCDGVLVNSEKFSCAALNIVFEKQYKIDIGTDYSNVLGKSLETSLEYYLDLHNIINYNLNELKNLKENAYFTLAENDLESFSNCEDFILLMDKLDILISVGSSGSHDKIKFSLNKVNLLKYFNIIVSTSDVDIGKPFPDLFLKAAQDMNILPENCLVIEDSLAGIQSAINARMQVVGFPGSFPIFELENNTNYVAINGYSDLIKLFNHQLN